MLQLSTEIPLAAVIWYAKRGGLLPPAKRERNRIEITQGEGGGRGGGGRGGGVMMYYCKMCLDSFPLN